MNEFRGETGFKTRIEEVWDLTVAYRDAEHVCEENKMESSLSPPRAPSNECPSIQEEEEQ